MMTLNKNVTTGALHIATWANFIIVMSQLGQLANTIKVNQPVIASIFGTSKAASIVFAATLIAQIAVIFAAHGPAIGTTGEPITVIPQPVESSTPEVTL